MSSPKVAPYGSWKSPLTSSLIASESIRLGGGILEGEEIYWVEGRPAEGGRNVIVKRTSDGQIRDVTPMPFNARTRVHEYGGGSVIIDRGTVYFSNFADQRLYRVRPGDMPESITPEAALRYADGVIDHTRNRIICVREDHTGEGEAVNTIAALALDGSGAQTVLVSGNDFYAAPRLSPGADKLAWITWNHPNMPWDGTELWIANVQADGTLAHARQIAGGLTESITQPVWAPAGASPEGTLYFISDHNGWWNLYRWHDNQVEPIIEMAAEFATPQWVFGLTSYAFESAQRIVCVYGEAGINHLGSINTQSKVLTPIALPFTIISSLSAAPGYVLFQGGSPSQSGALVLLNLTTGQTQILKRSDTLEVDDGYLSTPQAIEFPTEQGLSAHAFFYAPQNKDYIAPEGEKPPLLVISHGGPTGMATSKLSLSTQYWTSRGFAVLDVNYGGSAGYGRVYRERLNGQWGIVDVDDCVNGALYLVQQGLVDDERLAIRGGSAGGYTTLSVLAFRDVFKVGASYFGVSDLEALALDTHKFESRYLDRLIGPYPERRDLYHARSPIYHVDSLNCPVIFFQGLEDKVVAPRQAEMMVNALRQKGIPVAYIPFEGEQHGFRRAENIKRALDNELYFYARIFGFVLAESVEAIAIENLGTV